MPMTNARMYQAKVVEEQAPQTQNPSSNSLNPSLQSQLQFGHKPSTHNLKGNSTLSADQKQIKKTN
jgi:hypothetical protein